jgi:predicted 2-oxoglutarate/Fe(II)-dependent dioxygenase YbiX
MIIELPNYISAEEVAEIREAVKPYSNDPTYTYNREGTTVLISKIPELKELDIKLQAIFSRLYGNTIAPRYKPALASGDQGYEYHLYRSGDICHYHTDSEIAESTDRSCFQLRYASVILHLSTNEDGGDLIFPAQKQTVKTEAGKIVVFPPYGAFGHYTTPSSKPREVIVAWFVYKNVTVNFNEESGIYANR